MMDLQHLLKLHADVKQYGEAVRLTMTDGEIAGASACAGGALRSMASDQLVLHQAVGALCSRGWAAPCTLIIRPMLDIVAGVAIVTKDRSASEYMGFKYTHGFLKQELASRALAGSQPERARKQIEDAIEGLPEEHRGRARSFMYEQGPARYWHAPEYETPGEAVRKLCRQEVKQLHAMFSDRGHGSSLDMRLLRDSPDHIHPNPRDDVQSQTMALVAAIRLSLESLGAIDEFMTSGASKATNLQLQLRLGGSGPA